MVEYTCFRCEYTTKHRNSFKNHLNRKNVCKPVLDTIDVEEIKKFYGFEILEDLLQNAPNCSKITPKYSKNAPNHSKSIAPKCSNLLQNCSKIAPNCSILLQNNESKAVCEYCQRAYTRNSNLTKHLKTCKKKKMAESLVVIQNEEITKMKQEIEMLKKCKSVVTNNNTNNNTTTNSNNNNTNMINNIHINNYGDENLKHLRSKDFANLLSGIYSAVPKLIEKIHFDPEHPENQNIKFTNKKFPYLKVMKDDKWQLVNKKHELLDLIDSKYFMLKERYYSILEKKKYKLTDLQRTKIDEFMDKYNYEDKRMMIDLIERTELMLLNNS